MSGSPKNINELIAALEKLNGQILSNDRELYDECRLVFEKLKRLSDFDPNDIKKVIEVLEKLPGEIKELKIEELDIEKEDLESKALNKEELKELLDDYEKAEGKEEKDKIRKRINEITAKNNVKQFIESQKKILATDSDKNKVTKNDGEKEKETISELIEEYKKEEVVVERKKQIEKVIYQRSGEKETAKYIEKREEVIARHDEDLKGMEADLREKIIDNLTVVGIKQDEKTKVVIEKACLKKEFNKKEVEKEIKKQVKEPERVEEIVRKVIEIRSEIEVENKAEEIAQKSYTNLVKENIPVEKKVKADLKKEILVAWREGDELKIPKVLTEMEGGEVAAKEMVIAVENYKANNMEAIVNYRAITLDNEISYQLRESGVNDEELIKNFSRVSKELNYSTEVVVKEVNKKEIIGHIERENTTGKEMKVQPENAADEAKWLGQNVVKTPQKFNKLLEDYRFLSDKIKTKIGREKTDKIDNIFGKNGIKEVRITEKMAALFKDSPGALKIINGVQKITGFIEKANSFPVNVLKNVMTKLGVKDVGLKIIQKIGGQTAVNFVKSAALTIAKEGTIQGIKTIALGLLGKGGAAAIGSLAGVATGPVGWIVTAGLAVLGVLKKVGEKFKSFVKDKLNIDLNRVKKFISEDLGLGGFLGGVGQFLTDMVGLPALLGLISVGAIVTPIIIFVFIGIFVYSTLQQNLTSSLVPPVATGGGNCRLKGENEIIDPKLIIKQYVDESGRIWVCLSNELMPSIYPTIPMPTYNPSIPVPPGCPNMKPAAGYFTQGPFAQGCSHQNMSVPAIDIGAGLGTPIYATHPGVVTYGGGPNDTYGYYIDLHGNCDGRSFYTRYAHMPPNGYKVGNGATVAAGQLIGVVDNTGSSTGNHLHYHIVGLDTNKFGQYLGLDAATTAQLWGCCGAENGKPCP